MVAHYKNLKQPTQTYKRKWYNVIMKNTLKALLKKGSAFFICLPKENIHGSQKT